MRENELRFALDLVTEGASHETAPDAAVRRFAGPRAARAGALSTERFRRESRTLASRARPWVLGEGVQGLGVGEKLIDSRGTGELALRVYVASKKPRSQVAHPVPSRVRVPEIGDFPTDVLEIGRVRAEAFRGRVRPAMPGSSVGHPDSGVGTFGCVVEKRGEGRDLFILSNAHVLADEGCGEPGDIVLQPAINDGGDPDTDVIAELERAQPFVFSEAGFENLMDAAIARVRRRCDVEAAVRLLGHPVRGVARVLRRGLEVMKVGRTTDHTLGVVQDVDFRFHMPYKAPGHRSLHFGRPGHTRTARVGFRDQVLCSRYTAEGDSGAAVLNRRGYLLGLHFAGSESASVFSPIRPVFRALGLRLHRP